VVIKKGAPQSREQQLHGAEGSTWFRVTRLPVPNPSGKITALLVIGQDLSLQKQSEETLEFWTSGLTSLHAAEQVMAEAGNLEAARENLLIWAGKLVDSSHVGLWRFSPQNSTAKLIAGLGKLELLVGVQLNPGEDLPWRVWRSGETIRVDDYQAWFDRGQWAKDAGLTSATGYALKHGGKVDYILTLFHDHPERHFLEEEVQLLNLFSQVAATRLQHIETLETCQDELEEQAQSNAELKFRSRLEHSLAVISSNFILLDPDKIDEGISHALKTIAEIADINRCYVIQFPMGTAYNAGPNAWYSRRHDSASKVREDLGQETFRWYMRKFNQLESIHIPHPEELAGDDRVASAYLKEMNIQAYAAFPLLSNRSLIGYMGFESSSDELDWSARRCSLTCWNASVSGWNSPVTRKKSKTS